MVCSCSTFVAQPVLTAARAGTSAEISAAAANNVARISVSVSATDSPVRRLRSVRRCSECRELREEAGVAAVPPPGERDLAAVGARAQDTLQLPRGVVAEALDVVEQQRDRSQRASGGLRLHRCVEDAEAMLLVAALSALIAQAVPPDARDVRPRGCQQHETRQIHGRHLLANAAAAVECRIAQLR